MAVRYLYTVAAMTVVRHQFSDFILGFTVARNDDEVERIVRQHCHGKKVEVLHCATAGISKPEDGRDAATILMDYGFIWIDPQPPDARDVTKSARDAVFDALASGLAC